MYTITVTIRMVSKLFSDYCNLLKSITDSNSLLTLTQTMSAERA